MSAAPADSNESGNIHETFSPETSNHKSPTASFSMRQPISDNTTLMGDESSTSANKITSIEKIGDVAYDLPCSPSRIGGSDSLQYSRSGARRSSQAQVFVGKKHGDGIFVDDPAFLAVRKSARCCPRPFLHCC
jgi:hypothetical protein